MAGTLIIFLFFVLPIALRLYAIDKDQFIFVKVVNLLITFLLSSYMVDSFKEQAYWLSEICCEPINSMHIKVGVIPPLINIVGYYVYIFSSLIMIILLIFLALRNRKAHILFKYIIPFTWVSQVVLFNFEYYEELQSKFTADISIKFILYLLLLLGIFWSIILLIYYSKSFKKFFKSTPNLDDHFNWKNINKR